MTDTVDVVASKQAMKNLLNGVNRLDAYYHLVFIYMNEGNYSLAEQVMSNIPNQISLSTIQNEEYLAMQSYYNIRKQMRQNGQMIGASSTDQLLELLEIAENEWGLASTYARSILQVHNMWENELPKESELKTSTIKENEYNSLKSVLKSRSFMQISPNPAKDFIIVKFILKNTESSNAYLQINSMDSKHIDYIPLEKQVNEKVVDVSRLIPGNYAIALINDGKIVERGRFTIVK